MPLPSAQVVIEGAASEFSEQEEILLCPFGISFLQDVMDGFVPGWCQQLLMGQQ